MHAYRRLRMRAAHVAFPSSLYLILFFMLARGDEAWCARRAIKKQQPQPSLWFGSSDFTFTHLAREREAGGGENRIAGLQLGLNLPDNASAFVRLSASPEPHGLLDTRIGISKALVFSDSVRNTFSNSFSIPTSDYSRELHQATQASLASTLEYSRRAWTFSFTGYGVKAVYTEPEEVIDYEVIYLNQGRGKGNAKKSKNQSAEQIVGESITINYGDPIFATRFDKLWGGSLDLGYRFSPEWTLNGGGSLTRIFFTSGGTAWSCDVTLLQATFSRQSWVFYASSGLSDGGAALFWPHFRLLTVGASYLFPN